MGGLSIPFVGIALLEEEIDGGVCGRFFILAQPFLTLPLLGSLSATPRTLLVFASVPQASYGVEDPEYAVTQLAQTTMRSELGKLSLDRVFRVSRGGGYQHCQRLASSQLHFA